jgi:hypothetical protein
VGAGASSTAVGGATSGSRSAGRSSGGHGARRAGAGANGGLARRQGTAEIANVGVASFLVLLVADVVVDALLEEVLADVCGHSVLVVLQARSRVVGRASALVRDVGLMYLVSLVDNAFYRAQPILTTKQLLMEGLLSQRAVQLLYSP